MAKFLMTPTVAGSRVVSARLGSASGSANYLAGATEVGKFVKLAGESRYNLCAAGDNIEGIIVGVESASLDDFSFGSVQTDGRLDVTFDGLQATPGTGAVAVGDYVVVGTAVAKGTAIASTQYARVTKATLQPTTVPASLTEAGTMVRQALFAWRVVSLGSAGTGAVATAGVIERVCVAK